MSRVLLLLGAAAAAMLGLGTAPAFAQARVFVSGHGDDGNPCSLSAPCRSFQQAHDTVAAGGEIVALDAAGYGTLFISKAVTVTAIGIEASITASGSAISINAASTDVVAIRGVTMIGAGGSTDTGIQINSAQSVTIRDCSISGFFDGVQVRPSANLNVELRDVSASNNFKGLAVTPSGSGKLTLLVSGSSFTGSNANGVQLDGSSSTGTITATLNLISAANLGDGISVTSAAGQAQPVVMVTGAKLVNNLAVGLDGGGPVQVFVDRTQISGNGGNGWQAGSGAVVKSYTNNEVNGNGNDNLNGVTQITSE